MIGLWALLSLAATARHGACWSWQPAVFPVAPELYCCATTASVCDGVQNGLWAGTGTTCPDDELGR